MTPQRAECHRRTVFPSKILSPVESSARYNCVIRLRLGRRLVDLLPVAQRTNAIPKGVVDRLWVVGREFESHVHHEKAFFSDFPPIEESEKSRSLVPQRI